MEVPGDPRSQVACCCLRQVASPTWERAIGAVKDPAEFKKLLNQYSIRRYKRDFLPQIPEPARYQHKVSMPTSVIQMHRTALKEYRIEHPELEEQVNAEFMGEIL